MREMFAELSALLEYGLERSTKEVPLQKYW